MSAGEKEPLLPDVLAQVLRKQGPFSTSIMWRLGSYRLAWLLRESGSIDESLALMYKLRGLPASSDGEVSLGHSDRDDQL